MTVSQQLRARADEVLERHEAGELESALAAAESLAADAEAASTDDAVVRETLFTARFERAVLLTELGDALAAISAYADAESVPADLLDPDQRHEIAMARLNRGILCDSIGEHDAAIQAYEDLVVEFQDADDPVTADQVVRARVNLAGAFLAAGREPAALSTAEWLVEHLDGNEPGQAEQLAMAVRIRAAALRALGRVQDASVALTVERDLVDDTAVRVQMLAAQLEHARALLELGRSQEAASLTKSVADEVGDSPAPEFFDVEPWLGELCATLGVAHDGFDGRDGPGG